jgi:hypothetical protein
MQTKGPDVINTGSPAKKRQIIETKNSVKHFLVEALWLKSLKDLSVKECAKIYVD